MSIKQMQKVWDNQELEANKKLIMLSLCDNANDEGFCYPSIDTTCKKTGLSKPTVIKHQKELESDGYLLSKKRNSRGTNNGGKRLSTIYIVFPSENMQLLDEEILERFISENSQSKEALPLGQSKEALPLNGSQSKEALPKPSLSLFNHHLFNKLNKEEKDLYLEYISLRKKMKLQTTNTIHDRLLNKYFDFGRNIEIIKRSITSNWKDFYEVKEFKQFKSNEPEPGSAAYYEKINENLIDTEVIK